MSFGKKIVSNFYAMHGNSLIQHNLQMDGTRGRRGGVCVDPKIWVVIPSRFG
jgi:hypothetical protein